MASNKNALIRYNTIDRCLRNTAKQWTIEDLVDACSDALYEFEGKDDLVSKRTIQLDLQNMRSEKLGYSAPIEVYHRKYYRYSDPNFSIKNIPVSDNDLKAMNDALQILMQFKDFSVFQEMSGVLQKLEDSLSSTKQKAIIHLDKNEKLRGLQYVDPLYRAILNKKALVISYKSFNAREERQYTVHPQLLKEFNNRWFLLAWTQEKLLTLALDRIEAISASDEIYIDKELDGDTYFNEVVGVTVSRKLRPMNVIFKIDRFNAPYVLTKPLHHSQMVMENHEDGSVTLKILVQLNYELERLLLGFGESLTVLKPKHLKKTMLKKLSAAMQNYKN